MQRIMFLCLMLLSSVLGAPNNEPAHHRDKGLMRNIDKRILSDTDLLIEKYKEPNDPEILGLDAGNQYFKRFIEIMEKGITAKGLTFNLYNDKLREAAVTLFRLFQSTEGEVFERVNDWAKNNTNREMYMYALRLESLYSRKTNESNIVPPFIWNPHYFVNSETLAKASLIANDIKTNGRIDQQISKVDHYDYAGFISLQNFVVLNTNYSGWNLPSNGMVDKINYFREDISLNSHYLGLHLLHPFWMSNQELEVYNPRFAEHYYYVHQQLMARYKLEKLHLKTDMTSKGLDGWDYIPYLSYKNGLTFPTRSCNRVYWDNETALLKTIDGEIRECISRAQLKLKNEPLDTKNDNEINLLANIMRANIDEVKLAKILRSIVGYGGMKYDVDEYNPAPSLLHHPETSLRDPAYWYIIQRMVEYFSDYKNTLEPIDLKQYQTEEFQIVNHRFSTLTTLFSNFKFSVNYATSNFIQDVSDWPYYVTVRQRRLTHEEFSLNFFVESLVNKSAIVRLYLGPDCSNDCWKIYDSFFEIDTFPYRLAEGLNLISWCPESSNRYSFDYGYDSVLPIPGFVKYSLFRFPESLLIPRGLEEGLNLTVFIMITPADSDSKTFKTQPKQHLYRENTLTHDSKPLGFPFHKKAVGFNETAFNYKFYKVPIYHKHQPADSGYYFSSNLN